MAIILYILGSLVPKNRIESANAFSLAAIFDDTEMKRPYTKQLYELIYKHTRIKPDPQVFLGMVARAQTVDTRPFFVFFVSGLGTRLVAHILFLFSVCASCKLCTEPSTSNEETVVLHYTTRVERGTCLTIHFT